MAAVIALGGVLLYELRGPIGSRLAMAYLARRGIASAVVIDRLDRDGFVGHVRLGPADDPDLVIDRVEAAFGPISILKGGLTVPPLRSLRLVHPRLKATYDGKRFNVGALQPLVEEALAAPPGAGPGPDVFVERGELRLASFAGPLVLTGDATLEHGRIRRAAIHAAPAWLRLRSDLTLRLNGADLALSSQSDRLDASVRATLAGVDGAAAVGRSQLEMTLALPYGPSGPAQFNGRAAADYHLAAETASMSGGALGGLALAGTLSGDIGGSTSAPTLDLAAQATGTADRYDGPGGVHARRISIAASGGGLRWRRSAAGQTLTAATATVKATSAALSAGAATTLDQPALTLALSDLAAQSRTGGWSGHADLSLGGAAARLGQTSAAGKLTLASPRLDARGRVDLAAGGPPSLILAGSLAGRQGALDPASARRWADSLALVGDPVRIAAALRGFALAAPAWRLELKDGGGKLALGRPLRLTGGDGAALMLAGRANGPVAQMRRDGSATGGFDAALSGRGLPGLTLTVRSYRFAGGRGAADIELASHFDGAMWRGAALGGSGRLTLDGGTARFSPAGCLDARLERLGAEAPPLAQDVSAQVCADAAGPLVSVGPAGWRLEARIDKGAAKLPTALSAIDAAQGRLSLAGRAAPTTGRLELTRLHATDTAPAPRFRPVQVAGALDLDGRDWRGRLDVSDAAKARPLASVTVRQSASGPEGQADIDAAHLDFSPNSLQPAELSPLAVLITKVEAKTRFTGQIAWNGPAVTSGGRFTTHGAAFASPAGPVTGARADVVFSSLLPPTAAPGQSFEADRIGWIAPLTAVSARFALTPTTVELAQADAVVAHGAANLGPLSIPFAEDRTLNGTLTLKQVDLGELIAGSNLADSVALQARIDGTVPFSAGPMGVHFADGLIVSAGAGRLSIKRQALTGAMATAGGAGAQPNAIQDFAYQALENLAFDSLEARIASRPGGRLGAVFHIKGRNDPPKPTHSRIGLIDLIRGHAFDKPIDLPKGTPIDLTLDTSLNFDELLKAYGEIGRNGSAAVQP